MYILLATTYPNPLVNTQQFYPQVLLHLVQQKKEGIVQTSYVAKELYTKSKHDFNMSCGQLLTF